MPSKQEPTSRKASIELREELLSFLGAPAGSVTISRQPSAEGDVIVVRMLSSRAVHPSKRPQNYKGFKVSYQVAPAVKAGRW
jgi:hypothetical protein